MQENNNYESNNELNQNSNQAEPNDQNTHYYTASYCSSNYQNQGYAFPQNQGIDQSNPNREPSEPPKKKISKAPIIIACVVIVSVLLIACLSLLTTFIAKLNNLTQANDYRVNVSDEELLVIQNSPQIDLSKSTDSDYIPQSIPEVVQKIGDSVVEISTSSVVNDRFFHQYVTSGAGSGVIITQSNDAGYLLTNHHVIDGATEITVRLTNGAEYKAQLLGSDADEDLAVLRISKKATEVFTVAPIGDSSKLAVGQQVIAIGNPLGSLGGTVTDGIISALDRTVTIDNVSMVLLQHNAAINPGNSGGGLFDAMGNLIGIVNAKTSETGIEGLGFAIPVNIAYKFFNRIMIIEPSLGIKVTYGSVNRVAGVYVTDVADTNNKFELYDRIISVNDVSIRTAADYYNIIDDLTSGDTVIFKVERDRRDIDIEITVK